jgi:hypothetical protein
MFSVSEAVFCPSQYYSPQLATTKNIDTTLFSSGIDCILSSSRCKMSDNLSSACSSLSTLLIFSLLNVDDHMDWE